MKFVPNAVSRKVARQVLVGQKHAPTILFGAGVVGVVATTVLACKATLKLEETLDEVNENLEAAKLTRFPEDASQRDVAYIYVQGITRVARLYAPAIACGALSIGALAGSHRVLTKRNLALTAAYSAVEKGFNDYRTRVVEEFGEDKDRELRYGTDTEKITTEGKDGKTKTKEVKIVGPNSASVYARFFDEYCKNWKRQPEYNLLFLQCQQNYANDLLQSRGHIFLNEVYDMIGIDRSKAGAVVGWVISKDGDNFVDFGIFDGDNPKARDFVNGREGSILLDFNVDGVIYDKI
jgi:hypothetical protein